MSRSYDIERTEQGLDITEASAEIERLGSVIDATVRHWLALHDKHPIQWEGGIDGAMAAACAEIEKLREALHEIDIEAANTLPRDGKDAAFAALFRIAQIINPFRLASAALGETK